MQLIPIECTLTPVNAVDRVDEWRTFLATNIDDVVLDDAQARLRLRPSDAVTLAAIELAAREKACCAFFTFSIDIHVDQHWLVVGVPEDAAPVLREFLSLLPKEVHRG
ncbi:MAG: hypothetical protein QOG53_2347 [Frankiales bacterium]|nr:hypothetical protein [Frankiales bacterium]